MKVFIFISLLAYTLAEPPVGDSYASARSSHHHDHDGGRSLSQEYGVPEFGARNQKDYSLIAARNQPSQTYGAPARSAVSQEYGTPNLRSSLSQEYGPPNLRSSLSQEYGPPNLRSSLSQEYGTPNLRSSLSQEYGTPNLRSSLSQEYGTPNLRSSLSQEYGTPNLRSTPSQEYGTPSFRTAPSLEYGVPKSGSLSQQYGPPASRNLVASEYNTHQQDFGVHSARLTQDFVPQSKSPALQFNSSVDFPSDTYGPPLQSSFERSQPEQRNPSVEYGVPSQRNLDQSVRVPSQKYDSPNFRNTQSFGQEKPSPAARFSAKTSSVTRNYQPSFGSRSSVSQTYGTPRSLSTQYGAPVSRNIDSYSPTSKSISQTYLPSSRTVSQSYGVPSERGLSTEYGVPESEINLRTNATASQFDLTRSSPSDKYGVPEARMPSEQYGVPEQYDSQDSQGYNYARNALDELLNQEPANYDFGYKVNDFESGSDFGHKETRQDNKAEGTYFVLLPDGTKQVVEYEADERGFKPRISVEPAEARSGGYDDNAANVERSADGPY